MNNRQTPFENLRFERPRKISIPKYVVIGIGLLTFTLAWRLVPSTVLYWLLLPVVGVLSWIASFGWRAALAALHDLLDQLERL